jgi:hypothetical protein
MQSIDSSSNNLLSYGLIDTLNILNNELRRQITGTEAELIQVKKLMDNAIDNIVDSFMSLETSTRIAQHLMKNMAASESDSSDELNPFHNRKIQSAQLLSDAAAALENMLSNANYHQTACAQLDSFQTTEPVNKHYKNIQLTGAQLIAEANEIKSKITALIDDNNNNLILVTEEISKINLQIETDVQAAIKSLQFQDMTSQLIVQCIERQHIAKKLLDVFSTIKNIDISSKQQTWQTTLATLNENLLNISKVRMKAFNVDASSVELF